MSEQKRYTAQEMRDTADHIYADYGVARIPISETPLTYKDVRGWEIAAMLRQAADDAEELAKVKARFELGKQKESTTKDIRNALAELATNLIDAMTAIAETGLIADRHVDAISHAQRIVAELAKVSNISQIPIQHWNCKELEALKNCRAIAEGSK